VTAFSAKHWISNNCYGGETLKPEAIEVISDFTLMWNVFEGALCNNHANIQKFERLATAIIAQCVSLPVEIQDAVRFWSARYLTDRKFNNRFYGLHFRPNNRQEHVEAVLRRETDDPQGQLLAVMIIIYRLRNNLFHGLKQIDSLNEQMRNLATASHALAAIVQISQPPPPIIIIHKAPFTALLPVSTLA
jgi:hypothetical protein